MNRHLLVDRIAGTHPAVTLQGTFIFSANNPLKIATTYIRKEEHMRFENAGRRANFKLMLFCLALMICMLLVTRPSFARPDNAFDLTGPKIEMHVTRAGKMLPIADVSNLQTEDRLWIHVELPDDQAVHYLLVVAFLRGSTNPPPAPQTRRRRIGLQERKHGTSKYSRRELSLLFRRMPSRPCSS